MFVRICPNSKNCCNNLLTVKKLFFLKYYDDMSHCFFVPLRPFKNDKLIYLLMIMLNVISKLNIVKYSNIYDQC